jgi:hypothetical protein
MANLPGPRHKRELPHPVDELTMADQPLPTAVAAPPAAVEEPASRLAALDGPEPEREDLNQGFTAGVTPSADWDDDDCWSAPV